MHSILLTMAVIASATAQPEPIQVGAFQQEVRTFYSAADGLPSDDVRAVAIANDGVVYAGTAEGLAYFVDAAWHAHPEIKGAPVNVLAPSALNDGVLTVFDFTVVGALEDVVTSTNFFKIPSGSTIQALISTGALAYLGADNGILVPSNHTYSPAGFGSDDPASIRGFAVFAGKPTAAATEAGLYLSRGGYHRDMSKVFPIDGNRSWAPIDVRGVAYDSEGRLWFASPQGVGCYDGEWTLYTGADGLPYNDFTCVAAGGDGAVWFGTSKGAIRFDGEHWAYRQGLRWLPNDEVRAIAVDDNGNAWIATAGGVALIERKSMTLAEKAAHYQYEIEHYIKRTPYGFTAESSVATPGNPSEITHHDSDNDGLWTAMYGAGECFAYGATKDPASKARAKAVFDALHFLGEVTQGGEHAPPKGYVARTILPIDGPDPNEGRLEHDRREKAESDALWKVYEPRWPKSADGKWYWKSDTSSDELDGHYFLYGLYYDLVADTEEEKDRVRKHVKALTDHLIKHDFVLIDHDGTPTRWARYNPDELNHDKDWWVERGLKSLSMLSYLSVTHHITGDEKYRRVARKLMDKHAFEQNMMVPKIQRGLGTGNQSDDEMALMCFYNLLKYETDPELKSRYALSFWQYWRLELPEMNPFFNFCYPAVAHGLTFTDAWGTHDLSTEGDWLNDAVNSLQRLPLDRFDWQHDNTARIDITRMPDWMRGFDERPRPNRGHRVNGKAIPYDERHFNHYNHDAFALETGGSGRGLANGTVFTLPYYMGLYHGFIKETTN